jgi:hypothetical protein
MSREIPEPIRAAAGLAATVLDEARKLPGTLPGLPVRVIGLAMQTALKVQQQWAGLVARGDELLTGIRGEDEPGLATFDDDVDLDAPSARSSARASAFDRATVDDGDLAVEDTAAALDETDAVPGGPLVDDEVSGLAAAPDPDEVVESLQDITDQVAAIDEAAALTDAEAVLTPEDALESALLENGAADDVPGVPADPGGSPVGEVDGVPDVGAPATGDTAGSDVTASDPAASDPADDTTGGEITEVDVLTPDGEVETVEATVTDEAIAAPETLADLEPADPGAAPVTEADADGADQGTDEGAAGAATAVDEGGTPVAAATGPSAPVSGYDGWTVAQLRGRLRGYQLSTVADLLSYEESTRAREPFLRMLRNRLEKLERQAVEASPLAPRGM